MLSFFGKMPSNKEIKIIIKNIVRDVVACKDGGQRLLHQTIATTSDALSLRAGASISIIITSPPTGLAHPCHNQASRPAPFIHHATIYDAHDKVGRRSVIHHHHHRRRHRQPGGGRAAPFAHRPPSD
ncbi:hypothetical protein JDV02_001586 [Purpureocillium takamizusanense]|uniref:Uncharacterized protein n=1 Tax=Purpureocillium takamizusanense TaxID=2060973 RepID=A0A9Q8Q983_9HYPO|nr:uncharacterized protein JDV02_001586 [Purpureocillium takamizusanense]UNI15011.1 hypothetical protein JDV02_001586 [Purpureocillium takamizusanense]